MRKRWTGTAAAFLTLCCLLLLVSPCAAAGDAGAADRWEMRMIRADLSARIDLLGQGVRVAVIDSGVAPLPGLPGLETGRDYTGEGSTADSDSHGTSIAGIIAGNAPDGTYRGVAPEAALVPLRCFSDRVGEVSSVVSAIYDAVDEFGCQVISLSFGQKKDDEELREAVAYALSKGVVVVAAAGNSGGREPFYPAAYEGVIGVNAVDSAGTVARDAQHNDAVALTAPGVRVSGMMPEGGYGSRSGSSFAVPYVAGAAAVLLSADGSLTPEEIRDLLCRTAVDRGKPGWDEYYGWGILDLEAALREALGAYGCWLSVPEAAAGGVELTAYNPGTEPVDALCRLGEQVLPALLEPGDCAVLRFAPQLTAADCAVWIADDAGGEVCISNVREWEGYTPVFSDVPEDAWFCSAVSAAAVSGVMVGLPDGRFDPAGEVTRAMFVTVLYRASGSPSPAEPGPFADVDPEAWYAPAVSWAADCGLVSGVSAERFAPEQPLTREALAVILMRMGAGEGREPSGRSLSDFSDGEDVSGWALEGMDYCVAAGLLQGVSETELLPRGTLNRASLAVLLVRLSEQPEMAGAETGGEAEAEAGAEAGDGAAVGD